MAKSMFNETVIDHFMNPRNVGEIDDADAVGQAGNPEHGNTMRLYLKVHNGIITDAKFKTFGCSAAIASSSITTELLKGKSIDEAPLLTHEEILRALGGLPETKIHCSVMAEQAVRAAIEDYLKKKGQ